MQRFLNKHVQNELPYESITSSIRCKLIWAFACQYNFKLFASNRSTGARQTGPIASTRRTSQITMTDAYEDAFAPQELLHAHGDALPLEEAAACDSNCNKPSPPLHTSPSFAASEPWETRLLAAEKRREEFRAWLLHKTRKRNTRNMTEVERVAAEERRARHLEKLEGRLAAAEANRAAALARRQRRAAATNQRREDAAERVAAALAERSGAVSERLAADLAAAESRRMALREAEQERLRAEHELVLSRLAAKQELAASVHEQQRTRLEAKLAQADSERDARLARRAARAAARQGERARPVAGVKEHRAGSQEDDDGGPVPTASEGGLIEGNGATPTQPQQHASQGDAAEGAVAAPVEVADGPGGEPTSSELDVGETELEQEEEEKEGEQEGEEQSEQEGEECKECEEESDEEGSEEAEDSEVQVEEEVDGQDISQPGQVEGEYGNNEGGDNNNGSCCNGTATGSLETLLRSLSTRRLQRGWRAWVAGQRTTRELAEAFVATGLTGLSVIPPTAPPSVSKGAVTSASSGAGAGGDSGGGRAATPAVAAVAGPPVQTAVVIGHLGSGAAGGGGGGGGGNGETDDDFDRFAAALRSSTTLKATQALLRRLEQRLAARTKTPVQSSPTDPRGRTPIISPAAGKGAVSPTHGPQSPSNVTHLLRRLNPRAPRDARLERYPPRVLLCAFMIVRHPEVVFSGSGTREAALAAAARHLVSRLEALLERIILAPVPSPQRSVHPVQPYNILTQIPYDTAQCHSPAAAALRSSPSLAAAPIAIPSGGGGGGGAGSTSNPALPFMPLSPVGRGLHEVMRKRRAEAEAAAAAAVVVAPPTKATTFRDQGATTLEAEANNESSTAVSPYSSMSYATIGGLVLQFDEAWLRYLDQFVTWKGADAAALESELVRCAAALETSMLRKCRGDPASERVARSSDLRAVIAQVAHDQALLRERVAKLGGEAGLRRLEAALADARRVVAEELATRGLPETSSASSPSASATSPSASEVDATDLEVLSPGTRRLPPSPSPTSRRPPPLSPTRSNPTIATAPATAVTTARPPPLNAPLSSASGEVATTAFPPYSPSPPLGQSGPLESFLGGNVALVHQVLLAAAANTRPYRLPSSEAEAAWARAVAAVELDTVGVAGLAVLAPGPDPEELRAMGQEQLIRTLRSRTAAIAECAFWDNVISALDSAWAPEVGDRSDGDVSSGGSGGGSGDMGAGGRDGSGGDARSDGGGGGGGSGGPHPNTPSPSVPLMVAARLADLLAPLLSGMAGEVAAVVNSSQQAATIRSQFAEATLRSDIMAAATAATANSSGTTTTTAVVVSAVQPVLAALERLGALLVAAGAPAREVNALAAHGSMRQRLTSALAATSVPGAATGAVVRSSSGNDDTAAALGPVGTAVTVSPLAAALGAAVRLLSAQIKLLRLDAANGRLQALAASLQGDGAVLYLRAKFASSFRLPPPDGPAPSVAATGTTDPSATTTTAAAAAPGPSAPLPPPPPSLRQSLPRTADWWRRSHATAESLRSYIQAQGIDISAAVSAAAATTAAAVPGSLRSGLRQAPSGGGGGTEAAAAAALRAAVAPVLPVGPTPHGGASASWRWLLRAGLVGLVSGDVAAVGPSLAETLVWDGERLHAAQNEFQQLVVVTAGILLVSQLRSTAATSPSSTTSPAWGPEARSSAARRLLVLAADPGMRLPYLTSELASLAGVAGDEAAESRLRTVFMNFMDPASAPFRSITTALAAALLLHLTLGPPMSSSSSSHEPQTPLLTHGSPSRSTAAAMGSNSVGSPAATAAVHLLGRVGAGGLSGDVAALGERLMAVVAVNEAVHGELYDKLNGEFVRQERKGPKDDDESAPMAAVVHGLQEKPAGGVKRQHVATSSLQAQNTPRDEGEGFAGHQGRQHWQVSAVGQGHTVLSSGKGGGVEDEKLLGQGGVDDNLGEQYGGLAEGDEI